MKKVYIVLSQTGTALSKILKLITGAEYNHASISLDGTLHELYSFGRVYPRNPVIGGFVRESKNSGTFKRFCKTKIIVLQTEVSDDIYCKMQNYLCYMYKRKKEFGYNYRGLFLAAVHVNAAHKNHYYCSEFVRHFLIKYGINDFMTYNTIVKPMDFLKLQKWDVVYQGEMQAYSPAKASPYIMWKCGKAGAV